jgi:hypothetical protein
MYKIAPLILNSGKKSGGAGQIFIAQPDAQKEDSAGKLFIHKWHTRRDWLLSVAAASSFGFASPAYAVCLSSLSNPLFRRFKSTDTQHKKYHPLKGWHFLWRTRRKR